MVKQERQPGKAFGKEARQQQGDHHGRSVAVVLAESRSQGCGLRPLQPALGEQRKGREPPLD